MVGVPLTEQGGVWKIRGRGDRIGINLIRPLSCVTFASCKLDLTEPRFALRKAAPCTEIPSLAFDAIEVGILKDEVVVLFSAVEGEVALFSENLGDRRDPLGGELPRLGPGGPVIVQTRRCLIIAGDHCGSAEQTAQNCWKTALDLASASIWGVLFLLMIPIATKQGDMSSIRPRECLACWWLPERLAGPEAVAEGAKFQCSGPTRRVLLGVFGNEYRLLNFRSVSAMANIHRGGYEDRFLGDILSVISYPLKPPNNKVQVIVLSDHHRFPCRRSSDFWASLSSASWLISSACLRFPAANEVTLF